MNNVISSDTFSKKRLEREYISLMKEYFSHPYPKLHNFSLIHICSNYRVKAIMSVELPGIGTIDTYSLTNQSDILLQLTDMEFDYTWISNSILRLGIGNLGLVWMDIYFDCNLSESIVEEITELLERDVLDNYAIIDDNMFELTHIHERIQDVCEEYAFKFGKDIRSML